MQGSVTVVRRKESVPERERQRAKRANRVKGAATAAIPATALGAMLSRKNPAGTAAMLGVPAAVTGAWAGGLRRVPTERTVLDVDKVKMKKNTDPFEIRKNQSSAQTGVSPVDTATRPQKKKARRLRSAVGRNFQATQRTQGLPEPEVNWRYSGAFL